MQRSACSALLPCFARAVRQFGMPMIGLQATACAAATRSEQEQQDSWLDIGSKFRRRAMLWWPHGRPRRVLLVKRQHDKQALDALSSIASWCAALLRDGAARVHVHPLARCMPPKVRGRTSALHSACISCRRLAYGSLTRLHSRP